MREAIERVIAELKSDMEGARALYKATKDDWYKGVADGRLGAIKSLEEVLSNHD